MCILLCIGPTPPCATVAWHPKFGAAELAHQCPAEAGRLCAGFGYVGKLERTWDSERAHGPNPAAATAHRRFPKRFKGLPFADPWRVGPAPASHRAPRPRDRVSSARRARIRQLLAADFLAQILWRSSRRRRRRPRGRRRRPPSPRRSTSGRARRRAASSARGHHHHHRGRGRRRPSTCPSTMMMRTRRRPCRSRIACTSTGAISSGCG